MKMKRLGLQALMRGLGVLSSVAPGFAAWIAFRMSMSPRRRHRNESGCERRWRTPSGLVVHEWGRSGPLVLCLHGWEGCAAQFAGLASHLREQGMRVWALDAIAHGQSPGRRATPLDMLHSAKEVCALAGEPMQVVGHSLGGALAVLAQREGADCRRIVLVSTPTGFIDVFDWFNRQARLSARSGQALVRRLEAHVRRPLDSFSLSGAAPTGPALLIHDTEDKEVPVECSVALARSWPGAQLWTTRGLGHQRILKDAAVWTRITDFLGPAACPRPPASEHHAQPATR
jgi:pimeloyl-ACP methyl ester carboxylesterase